MEEHRWECVTKLKAVGFAMAFGLFLLLLAYSEPGFLFVVDHANLLFHEAGHPLIGIFSARLEPYGGTIGQLVFPCVLAVGCWRKGQVVGLAAAGIWFFENWLNIARYIADARRLQLPLVGGGDHDWNTILDRWGILQYELQLAGIVSIIGWIGMIGAALWILWRAWRDRFRSKEHLDSLANAGHLLP